MASAGLAVDGSAAGTPEEIPRTTMKAKTEMMCFMRIDNERSELNGARNKIQKRGRTLTFPGEPLASPAMLSDSIEKLRAAVRDVPDFPKAGIVFKDIPPILGNGKLFRTAVQAFLEQCRGKQIDKIVGIDARGFLFGAAVAYDLGV